jgi:hypothetical protein
MGAFKRFETFGSRLFGLSGEGDETIYPGVGDPVTKSRVDFGESPDTSCHTAFIKGLFDVHQLTSLLSYATFDEERTITT